MSSPHAEPAEVLAAIRRAARVNALFALATGPADGPGWRPAAGLADPAEAGRLIAGVGSGLGDPAARVAASMVVLGYSARLVAPAVATLLRDQLVLDISADQVWWRYAPGSGFQLRLPAPAGRWTAGRDQRGADRDQRTADRDQWCREVIDEHLALLIGSVRAVVPVAQGLLWGNVASSLAGALRSLTHTGSVTAPACQRAGTALLEYGPLRGSGLLSVPDGQLSFLRRSCCLYYRLPGGGTCGDCPLRSSAVVGRPRRR